jgi:hypothetical protein
MKKIIPVFILISLNFPKTFCQQHLYTKIQTSTIVLLEKEDSLGNLIPHGTGFLLYNYKVAGEDYIVTCAHVLKNKFITIRVPLTEKFLNASKTGNIKELSVRNTKWIIDGTTMLSRIKLIKDSTYITNDSLDIAVLKLSFSKYYYNNDTFSMGKNTGIPLSLIKGSNDIEIGTDITFLGFPFQIGTNKGFYYSGYYSDINNTPLLRSGAVAWKANNNPTFLLDAISYTGNSGSPIFTKPELGEPPYLIGIITGHLFDPRLGKESDVNLGLANGIWIDRVLDLIKRKNF